ncbi:hypothetical protein [Bifidobacterium tsurumiense]|uniref:Uncharacterized protein n=1 Tax=Bifidobacterium tsurumiense TaxID=356829 RepID=A0A087EBF3_9BIFI|nr:hypothetical protein [Bifidobacterium tsurumiense]KFJ05104.1 hypothetical protein BITS_1636 [Bifidobacterium tsurumiense]
MVRLDTERMRLIAASPAVSEVTRCSRGNFRLCYEPDFLVHLLACLDAGDGPAKVFRYAGLPSSLIGYKRIERTAYRVRNSFETRSRLERFGDTWMRTHPDHVSVGVPADGSADSADEFSRIMVALSNRPTAFERELEAPSSEMRDVESLLGLSVAPAAESGAE